MSEDKSAVSSPSTFAAKVSNYYQAKEDYNNSFVTLFSKPINPNDKWEPLKEQETTQERTTNMSTHEKDQQSADLSGRSQEPTGSQNNTTTEAQKATILDHKAMPGPVKVENLPDAKSREELQKEAKELNK